MGAFANGYPQRTLEQFKELHPDIQGIEDLTEAEFAYATQLAIWATCEQLAVEDTAFENGRATLVKPTSDVQQIRVYESVVEILKLANGWTKQLYVAVNTPPDTRFASPYRLPCCPGISTRRQCALFTVYARGDDLSRRSGKCPSTVCDFLAQQVDAEEIRM